jgi:hypothetical protein
MVPLNPDINQLFRSALRIFSQISGEVVEEGPLCIGVANSCSSGLYNSFPNWDRLFHDCAIVNKSVICHGCKLMVPLNPDINQLYPQRTKNL